MVVEATLVVILGYFTLPLSSFSPILHIFMSQRNTYSTHIVIGLYLGPVIVLGTANFSTCYPVIQWSSPDKPISSQPTLLELLGYITDSQTSSKRSHFLRRLSPSQIIATSSAHIKDNGTLWCASSKSEPKTRRNKIGLKTVPWCTPSLIWILCNQQQFLRKSWPLCRCQV